MGSPDRNVRELILGGYISKWVIVSGPDIVSLERGRRSYVCSNTYDNTERNTLHTHTEKQYMSICVCLLNTK